MEKTGQELKKEKTGSLIDEIKNDNENWNWNWNWNHR